MMKEDIAIREMREEDCTRVSRVVSASFRRGAEENGFGESEVENYVMTQRTPKRGISWKIERGIHCAADFRPKHQIYKDL